MSVRIVAMDETTRREVRLPTASELPKWLSLRRKNGDLSLQELAQALSKRANNPISRQSIHNWETGEAMPSVDHLALLVSFFGSEHGEEISLPEVPQEPATS